jgi:hypothetical protein
MIKSITVNIHLDINEAVADVDALQQLGLTAVVGDGCITVRGPEDIVDHVLGKWGYSPTGEALDGARCPTCGQANAAPGTTVGHTNGCPEAFMSYSAGDEDVEAGDLAEDYPGQCITGPEVELTVICGWCPDARVKTEAAIARGETVTHGMCPACTVKFEAGQR